MSGKEKIKMKIDETKKALNQLTAGTFCRTQIRGHFGWKKTEFWSAKDEYELISKKSGSEGELEKAIYEHITEEGWSENV